MLKMKTLFFLCILQTQLSGYEIIHFNTRYIVPDHRKILDQLLEFELQNYQVIKTGIFENGKEEIFLEYDLPFELTGNDELKISLKLIEEKPPIKKLEGQKAIAECTGPWANLECQMRFKNLNFDLNKVERNMKINRVPNDLIRKKMDVLLAFSGDPIGVSKVIPLIK